MPNPSIPSKLSENDDIQAARDRLQSINLYSPDNIYDVSNPRIVEIINDLVAIIDPGNSFDLRNTLLGRAAGLLGLDTPIAQVGAVALIDQWQSRMISTFLRRRREVIALRSLEDRHPDLDTEFQVRDVNLTRGLHDSYDFEKVLDVVRGDNPFDNPINKNTTEYQLFQELTNPGTRGIIKTNVSRNRYGKWVNGNIPLRTVSYYLYGADNRFIQQEVGYDYLRDEIDIESDNGFNSPNYIPNEDEASIDNHVGKNVISSRDYRVEKGFGLGEQDTTQPADGFPEETEIVYDNDEPNNVVGNRGLLYYTSKLVSDSDRANRYMKLSNEEIGDERLRRGSNITCRVFHKLRKYDKYKADYATLMRLEGNGVEDSVARDWVVPKIHPFNAEDDYKRYMLSIENLAYNINESGLAEGDPSKVKFPKCEIGNHKGRLMWFAPYGIEFTENTSVSWNADEFLGRPEKVYTYNNAERTANLSFMLIMDYVEDFTGNRANIADVIAGCADGTPPINPPTPDPEPDRVIQKIPIDIPRYGGNDPKFYFPNDIRSLAGSASYETNGSPDNPTLGNFVSKNNPRGLETGLNNNFLLSVQDFIIFIHDRLVADENAFETAYLMRVEGNASRLFQTDVESSRDAYNRRLALDRANSLRDEIVRRYEEQFGTFPLEIEVITNSDDNAGIETESVAAIDSENTKLSRNAEAKLVQIPGVSFSEDVVIEIPVEQEEIDQNVNQTNLATNCGFPENTYDGNFEVGFDKIDYFAPAFHSQTPEDFHKRLTFLNQCTRIGSNLQNNENASNVVFGRPPFCILRLGDFMHTKCLITSLDISYDDDVWDLNPEGMGVQYMIARVNLSLVLFGGQSLKWPIERIQNAFDFNFYANSTFSKYKTGYYGKAIQAEARQTEINNNTR